MYDRVKEFLAAVAAKYPSVMLRQAYLSFGHRNMSLVNSNGIHFQTAQGTYHFTALFSGREGDDVSSFNYTGFSMRDLSETVGVWIAGYHAASSYLSSAYAGAGQVHRGSGHCTGLPGYLNRLLTGPLTDGPLISAPASTRTVWARRLLVLSLRFIPGQSLLRSRGYFVTGDGYAAENSTIIDRLRSPDLFAQPVRCQQDGWQRAPNRGGAYVVEPGDISLEGLIGQVKQGGVALTRFSGGSPSSNGDFSGVAKNSYYIEDGRIAYPIRETMVSGNFASLSAT